MGKKKFTLFYNLDRRRCDGQRRLRDRHSQDGLPYQNVTYEIGDVKSHKLVKARSTTCSRSCPWEQTFFARDHHHHAAVQLQEELGKAAPKPLPADARANLGPIVTVDPRSATVQKVAASVKGEDTLTTVRNILAWQQRTSRTSWRRSRSPTWISNRSTRSSSVAPRNVVVTLAVHRCMPRL